LDSKETLGEDLALAKKELATCSFELKQIIYLMVQIGSACPQRSLA